MARISVGLSELMATSRLRGFQLKRRYQTAVQAQNAQLMLLQAQTYDGLLLAQNRVLIHPEAQTPCE